MDLMSHLEPKRELPNTILLHELDPVQQVYFFTSGQYVIGYELNSRPIYVIKNPIKIDNALMDPKYPRQHLPIGDYDATFNQKSKLIYKTVGVCRGFFIRKHNWSCLTEHY